MFSVKAWSSISARFRIVSLGVMVLGLWLGLSQREPLPWFLKRHPNFALMLMIVGVLIAVLLLFVVVVIVTLAIVRNPVMP